MDFNELVDIVAKLRGPGGCPWDREQTRESLKKYLVEEFYELIDTIDEGDHEGMEEELGDLLFQVVLQSRLSEEEGRFNINDVVDGIARKMVNRHPHVFGGKNLRTAGEVEVKWEEHKKNEGKNHESVLGGVPNSLPALLRAQEIQRKATTAGFDWDRVEDALEKLEEELLEFRSALKKKDAGEITGELGDILFVLVRIANFVDVNPEDALRGTISKFVFRFAHIEGEALRQGRRVSDMTLSEMEALWKRAKE